MCTEESKQEETKPFYLKKEMRTLTQHASGMQLELLKPLLAG